MTTPTSSHSSVSLAALFDELEKIAEDRERKDQLKRWAKNTAAVVGAAGLGAAVTTAGEGLLKRHLGPTWATLPPATKRYIIGPALGLTTLGTGILAKKQYDEYQRGREAES